jgi:hypothetical protein
VPVEVATAAMRSRGGGSAISCFNPEPGADVPANTVQLSEFVLASMAATRLVAG